MQTRSQLRHGPVEEDYRQFPRHCNHAEISFAAYPVKSRGAVPVDARKGTRYVSAMIMFSSSHVWKIEIFVPWVRTANRARPRVNDNNVSNVYSVSR